MPQSGQTYRIPRVTLGYLVRCSRFGQSKSCASLDVAIQHKRVTIRNAPIGPTLRTLLRPIVLGMRAIVLAQLVETFRGLPVFHRSLAGHPSAVLAIRARDIS